MHNESDRGLRRWRAVALVALGLALGVSMAGTPAGAHLTTSLSHLFQHADKRYVNVGESLSATGHVQVGTAAATKYEYDVRRYVVEARPASVGVVVPIPVAITNGFCKDVDGCSVSISMVNWDEASQNGAVASREERLFISRTSGWWRFANTDVTALDDNGVVNDSQIFDCYFSDAEQYSGVANGRADAAPGFGILNIEGGSYSDTTTTCRVILED